jgi:hypothetical protein
MLAARAQWAVSASRLWTADCRPQVEQGPIDLSRYGSFDQALAYRPEHFTLTKLASLETYAENPAEDSRDVHVKRN